MSPLKNSQDKLESFKLTRGDSAEQKLTKCQVLREGRTPVGGENPVR